MNPREATRDTTSSRLRGIILREPGEELVVRATAQEVEAFGARRGEQVELLRPRMTYRAGAYRAGAVGMMTSSGPNYDPSEAQLPPAYLMLRPGAELFDADGNRVAIIQEINLTQDRIETTSYGEVDVAGNLVRSYVGGFVRCDIRAVGVR
jgi:hypothetical protein